MRIDFSPPLDVRKVEHAVLLYLSAKMFQFTKINLNFYRWSHAVYLADGFLAFVVNLCRVARTRSPDNRRATSLAFERCWTRFLNSAWPTSRATATLLLSALRKLTKILLLIRLAPCRWRSSLDVRLLRRDFLKLNTSLRSCCVIQKKKNENDGGERTIS